MKQNVRNSFNKFSEKKCNPWSTRPEVAQDTVWKPWKDLWIARRHVPVRLWDKKNVSRFEAGL